MPRFTQGQRVVLPGGVFATIEFQTHNDSVYVRRETGERALSWNDQVMTRAEALRTAARLVARIGNDVAADRLVELVEHLGAYVEQAALLADKADRERAAEVTA